MGVRQNRFESREIWGRNPDSFLTLLGPEIRVQTGEEEEASPPQHLDRKCTLSIRCHHPSQQGPSLAPVVSRTSQVIVLFVLFCLD